MFFRQFVVPSLGHASYLVGDPASGDAVLVDPRRDVAGSWTPPPPWPVA
jgi:hydroxyacylglutathione hydrolase